jgi:hypothetical protein
MEYFHRRNIAHRDIKLENTLLRVGVARHCRVLTVVATLFARSL